MIKKGVKTVYQNTLRIYILSDDRNIESVLKKVEPPEDCYFSFVTAGSVYELGTLPPDSAVIVDGLDKASDSLLSYGKKLVLLAEVSEADDADDALLFRADAIWLMPDENLDERLLTAYFEALANQMKTDADYRRQKVCLETAIDSIPDLVWFKDTVGSHMMVNDSFCRAVEKSKEQIYKRGHYYIWDIPREEYDKGEYVCLESEDIVMDARKTCLFDEKVKTKSGMRLFKTFKSPLIDRDGTIFGTCGIAQDVTDSSNVRGEMEVLIDSLPYAVLFEDASGEVLSTNSYFEKYFGSPDKIIGKKYSEWKHLYFGDNLINIAGREEIRVDVGGEERVLVFSEEPLHDVFRQHIGSIGVFRDVTLERQLERQASETANVDFLTGLGNMRSFSAKICELKNSPEITLVAFDMDHLAAVNKKFGHVIGDEALVITSQALRSCFWGSLLLRAGGDKFLAVCTSELDESQVRARAERALEMIKQSFAAHKQLKEQTVSAGAVRAYADEGYDFDRLMRESLSAINAAKAKGGDCFCFYGEQFDDDDIDI